MKACVLAVKMADAHRAWHQSLAGFTLADIVASLTRSAPARTRRLLARGGAGTPT